MNKEEIQRIIAQLNDLRNDSEAHFGIHQYGGGPDESYIKANKDGLVRFASELLAAANEKINSDANISIVHPLVNHDETDDWLDFDGTTYIEYIEVVDKNDRMPEAPVNSFQSKLVGLGCGIGLIGILLVFIVGIVSVARWFF